MDIQKEKPEFNETIKLVEAVLERLTFHAFEEVLIWSNEHASRALNLCLKKTLKEFESGDLILTSDYPTLKHFSVDSIIKALSTALDQAQDYQCNLNKEIDRLENQLSKTQVPEGFVLVPVKEIKTWYLDDSENMYREDPDWLCDIPIGEVVEVEHRVSYELDQDPVFAAIQWDEVNGDVGCYETFKSKEEAEKVAAHCKAMKEAQEQGHE